MSWESKESCRKRISGSYKRNFIGFRCNDGSKCNQQAKTFKEVTDISGIVLTKLDGTAKGGIVLTISAELGIPVKLIGGGEKIDDLQKFSPNDFVEALFEE